MFFPYNDLSQGPEGVIVLWGGILLVFVFVWMLIRWIQTAPKSPDPWDAAVEDSVESGDAVPICHRCLSPHNPQADFCPECGAPVGTYTNYLPFPYLFSIGHTLRIGTEGNYKHSFLTIFGFMFFAIVEYGLFAPVYWFMFLRRLVRNHSTEGSQPASMPPMN